MRVLSLTACTIAVLQVSEARAHVDAQLSLDGQAIVGLPQEYEPAELNVSEGWLRIGAKRLDFPPCVAKYFEQQRRVTLDLHASWYHESDTLPPYLAIDIQPHRRAYSFSLLFDLTSLEPIHFTVVIQESKFVTADHRIDVDERCLSEIDRSTKPIALD